jgi:hypothetical protein
MGYVTISEAAARSEASVEQVRRWARTGRIKARKDSNDRTDSPSEIWFVDERDLERHLGYKLRPSRWDLEQELLGLEKRMEAIIRDLSFTAQVLRDLRGQVYSELDPDVL